ncbi:hypothetical protein [Tissierella pigra]|uniref:Uncharacterized protein n=1 Tax=Tissierella pigra TaxID=2607614 RepID=A0A6N7XKT2_9FIRM|nr:hypothetical protein [Tissierella pigra]MSU01392.1 hypothetical protein [Tissierella pigra]
MKEFVGVVLEEIKGIVKSNGRNIADNSLRIMTLTDKVDNIKEDTKTISEVIADMQSDVNTLLDLNLQMKENIEEQRKCNQEIRLLFEKFIDNHKEISRDIDNLKRLDREIWGDRKVGAM